MQMRVGRKRQEAREGITAAVVTQVEIFKEMGQWEGK